MRLWKRELLSWNLQDAFWDNWLGNEAVARRRLVRIVEEFNKELERGQRKQKTPVVQQEKKSGNG